MEEKEIKKEEKKEVKHKKNSEVEKLRQENAALNDKILRVSAEMQNIKRHYSEDLEKLLKYNGEDVIKKILPVLDNFDRAIMMDTTTDEKYLEGFKLIYANLVNILKELGVTEIDCLNKQFDPNYREAVLAEEVIEEEPNVVLDVLQKGYMYKDKLLRPAMVKVNK